MTNDTKLITALLAKVEQLDARVRELEAERDRAEQHRRAFVAEGSV